MIKCNREDMKAIGIVGLAALIIFIGVVSSGVFSQQENTITETTVAEKNEVVVSGDCYSFKWGSWISPDCFSTKEEAKLRMDSLIDFSEKQKQYKEQEWVSVDEDIE